MEALSQTTVQDSNNQEEDVDVDMLEEVQIQEELLQTAGRTQSGRTTRTSKKRKLNEKETETETGGQLKSVHWQGFTVEWVEEGDPPVKRRKGRCKRCCALIAADLHSHGTNGLKNHLTACMKKKPAGGGQTILNYTTSGSRAPTGALTTWRFDILQWWLKNSPRYPVLSEMARDILAIPISSVASEAAFSTGGRVLSPYRSSLTSSMVEALICAEDWLRTSYIVKKDEEGVPHEELQREFEMVIALRAAAMGPTQTAQSESGMVSSQS